MKKILKLFLGFTMLLAPIVSVACSTPSMAKILTLADKIVSLQELGQKDIVSSNLELHSKVNEQFVDTLLDNLGIDKDDETTLNEYNFLKDQMRVISLSSELILGVSKLPGMSWLKEKLRLQSTHFNLRCITHGDNDQTEQACKNVGNDRSKNGDFNWGALVTNWLPDTNYWSISVTFLDKDKVGWRGFGNPKYARININQKVDLDSNGDVKGFSSGTTDEINSSLNALHFEKGSSVLVNNGSGITPFVNENNPNIGDIYQGFVQSSKLLDIESKFLDEESISLDMLHWSPSSVDLVNNFLLQDMNVGKIMQQYQEEVQEEVIDHFLNNPMYAGNEIKNKDIRILMSNRIFINSFSRLANYRDEFNTVWLPLMPIETKDDFQAQLLIINKILSQGWISVINILKEASLNTSFIGNDPNKPINFESLVNETNELIKKGRNTNVNALSEEYLSTSETIKLKENLNVMLDAIADLNKNQQNKLDIELDYSKNFMKTMFLSADSISTKIDLPEIDYPGMIEYQDGLSTSQLGLGDSRYYGIVYAPLSSLSNDKFEPDDYLNKMVADGTQFDLMVKNVDMELRINKMIHSYLKIIKQNTSWIPGEDVFAPLSMLDLGPIKAKIGNSATNLPTDGSGWFNELNYDTRLGLKKGDGPEKLSIQNFINLYQSSALSVYRQLFTYYNDDLKIWYPVPSNRTVTGPSADLVNKNNILIGSQEHKLAENQDDDLAFSKLIGINSDFKDKSPLAISSVKNTSDISYLRTTFQKNGYNDLKPGTYNIWDPFLLVPLVPKNVLNIYGNLSDSTHPSNYWKTSTFYKGEWYSRAFLQTDIWVAGNVAETYRTLPMFFDYNIRCNPKHVENNLDEIDAGLARPCMARQ